jgi:hypothetical protein
MNSPDVIIYEFYDQEGEPLFSKIKEYPSYIPPIGSRVLISENLGEFYFDFCGKVDDYFYEIESNQLSICCIAIFPITERDEERIKKYNEKNNG